MSEDTFDSSQILRKGRGRCSRCGRTTHAISVFTMAGKESILVDWVRDRKLWRRHQCPTPPAKVAA